MGSVESVGGAVNIGGGGAYVLGWKRWLCGRFVLVGDSSALVQKVIAHTEVGNELTIGDI